jgi:hypothetical protein
MLKFRKKPVVVEAVQFTGANAEECCKFIGRERLNSCGDGYIGIRTLEGSMTATPGDWIIRGVKGEFYPCKPDIFEQTYEAVSD